MSESISSSIRFLQAEWIPIRKHLFFSALPPILRRKSRAKQKLFCPRSFLPPAPPQIIFHVIVSHFAPVRNRRRIPHLTPVDCRILFSAPRLQQRRTLYRVVTHAFKFTSRFQRVPPRRRQLLRHNLFDCLG